MERQGKWIVAIGFIIILNSSCLNTSTPSTMAPPTRAEPAKSVNAAVLSGESLEQLIGEAQKEGTVVVYSFTSRVAKVEKVFEETYPGIDLVGLDMSSTEQIGKIKEAQIIKSNENKADVAYISDAPVVFGELVQTGLLERYVPPQIVKQVPAEFQRPLLANRLSTKVLMYNEKAYPNGSPIKNLWELTQPEWRGKVVMVDPLQRGDYLDFMTEIVLHSDEMATAYEQLYGSPIRLDAGSITVGEQWIQALFANDVVLVDDTDAVNNAIGLIGQTNPPVGFTSYSDRRDNQEEGWALQIANNVVPAPGIAFPALLGIIKDAPHPAAARLFILFIMGDNSPTGGAAYAPFYVPGDYATRTNIVPHPDAIPLDELKAWKVDPKQTYEIRQSVAHFILKLQ